MVISKRFVFRWMCVYFTKLPPVQKVAGIILENENIINFVFVPDSAHQTEQKQKSVHEEVTSIYLLAISLYLVLRRGAVPVTDSSCWLIWDPGPVPICPWRVPGPARQESHQQLAGRRCGTCCQYSHLLAQS